MNFKIENGRPVKIVKNRTFKQSLKISIIPFFALLWNIKNIKNTIKKRMEIQARRVFDDEIIEKFFKPL